MKRLLVVAIALFVACSSPTKPPAIVKIPGYNIITVALPDSATECQFNFGNEGVVLDTLPSDRSLTDTVSDTITMIYEVCSIPSKYFSCRSTTLTGVEDSISIFNGVVWKPKH